MAVPQLPHPAARALEEAQRDHAIVLRAFPEIVLEVADVLPPV